MTQDLEIELGGHHEACFSKNLFLLPGRCEMLASQVVLCKSRDANDDGNPLANILNGLCERTCRGGIFTTARREILVNYDHRCACVGCLSDDCGQEFSLLALVRKEFQGQLIVPQSYYRRVTTADVSKPWPGDHL